MIGAVNIGLFFLYWILIPFVLGLLWTRGMRKYENSAAMSMTAGLIFMLALFEILAVPMILTKQPYHILVNTWITIIWVVFLLSFMINFRRIPDIAKHCLVSVRALTITEGMIWSSVLFLILFQIYMPVGHMRVDTDDARFVAEAMEACELDTMLQYHPITGEFIGEPIGEMNKDIASPFPIYMALGGSLLQLPPAVSTHIFFPIIFIVYAYMVYDLIGGYFFTDSSKYRGLFLFFMALLHCFAYESIYAAGYTLLAVIWQGRSVLAMVIMPFIWLLLMRIMDQDGDQVKCYVMLLLAVIAGLLTSSMAIELLPILIGTYSIMIGVKNRAIKPAMITFLLLAPCIVGYCIYR